MAKAINTFDKGIQKDSAKVNQPKGSYRAALNAVTTSDDGDSYSLTNERGTIPLNVLPSGYLVVGSVNLDKDIIVFLVKDNAAEDIFELGLIDSDNTYTKVFSDFNGSDPRVEFMFSKNFPVDCVARTLFNGNRIVYYTDDNQPFGLFNIDSILDSGGVAPTIGESKIIPDLLMPKITFNRVTEGSGVLKAGAYQIVTRYVTKDSTPVNWSIPTDIIPIVNQGKGVAWSSYDGASQDTVTSKSIDLTFSNIDRTFQLLEVVAIRYEGVTSTFQAFIVETIPIAEKTTIDYSLRSIPEDSIPMTAEELKVLSVTYDRAKTLTQKDNRLFLGNLRETTADFNQELQSLANNITAVYHIDDYKHKQETDGEFLDYKNEKVVHDKRTYRRGEAYSFALAVIFKDGSESFAYHIPGNHKTTAWVSGNMTNNRVAAQPFGGTGGILGTYISDSQYEAAIDPATDPLYPGVGAGRDTTVSAIDNHVRHHMMPTLQQHPHYNNSSGSGVGGDETISLISVSFNFQEAFSQDLVDVIQDVRIYRERRDTPEKRSMLAQGISTGIAWTNDRYQDKTHAPKTGSYEGAAVQSSRVYKKAPGFGAMIIDNNVYDGTSPANLSADAGFTYNTVNHPSGGGTAWEAQYLKQFCFHSPETQLAEGVFLNEAEAATCDFQTELNMHGIASFDFVSSEIVKNRPLTGTRRGYENFNSLKLTIDFQGWDYLSAGKDYLPIRYAQKIEHGETTKLRTDDSNVQNYDFVNKYSTGFLFIDTAANPVAPQSQLACNESGGMTIQLNEGKDNVNIKDNSSVIPSQLVGLNSLDGEYRVNLMSIFKKSLANQYGAVESSEYIPIDSILQDGDTVSDLLSSGYNSREMHGGDTYITKFGVTNKNVWKRAMPMHNGSNSTFYNGYTSSDGVAASASDDGGDSYFFSTKSSIDGNLLRKGDEFHTLAYFFVESNINTEYRHEVVNQDGSESIPYYPKSGSDAVLIEPPENDDSKGYNTQYSFENNARTIFTPTAFTETIVNFNSRLIYSDRAEEDDVADAYRIFSQFDKYDLPKNTGGIWNIFVTNNILYSHTPKSLWTNYVNAMTQQSTDLGQVLLGTGGLFNPPSREMLTSAGGYAGCISQWGGIHSPFGYIFPDVLQGKMFMLTQQLEEISIHGMNQFFDNNLPTGLKESDIITDVTPGDIKNYPYTDNPIDPDSAGITGIWDFELGRALITKKGTSADFTYSYKPLAKTWISEHTYKPSNYVARNNEFFAFDNSQSSNVFHQHNRGDYGSFYTDGISVARSPFSVTIVLNEAPNFEKSFDNIDIHSVCYDGNFFDSLETFKQIQAYNDYQDSGLIDIDTNNNFEPTLGQAEILGRWKKNQFQIALPRDKQDVLHISDNWSNSSRLKSKYLEVDLIYPNDSGDSLKLTINFIESVFRIIAR